MRLFSRRKKLAKTAQLIQSPETLTESMPLFDLPALIEFDINLFYPIIKQLPPSDFLKCRLLSRTINKHANLILHSRIKTFYSDLTANNSGLFCLVLQNAKKEDVNLLKAYHGFLSGIYPTLCYDQVLFLTLQAIKTSPRIRDVTRYNTPTSKWWTLCFEKDPTFQALLASFVTKVLPIFKPKDPSWFHVDPVKQTSDIQKNQKILAKMALQVIDQTEVFIGELPTYIKIFLSQMYQTLKEYTDHEQASLDISAFFLLGIIFPKFERMRLLPHPLSNRMMIVSKILQVLVNGVFFGNKEAFMAFANDLVVRPSLERMKKARETLCLGDFPKEPVVFPPSVDGLSMNEDFCRSLGSLDVLQCENSLTRKTF